MSAIQIKPLLGCLVGGPRERVVEDQMKRRWRPKKKRWHLSTYHVCRHLLLVRISSSGLGVLWWLNSFDRILAEVCWRGERLFQVWWNIIFVFGDTCHIFLHTDSKEWNNRDHVQTSGRLAASLCETVPQLLRLQHLQRILESLGSTPFGSQVSDLTYLCSRLVASKHFIYWFHHRQGTSSVDNLSELEESRVKSVLFDSLEQFIAGQDDVHSVFNSLTESDTPPAVCGHVFKPGGDTLWQNIAFLSLFLSQRPVTTVATAAKMLLVCFAFSALQRASTSSIGICLFFCCNHFAYNFQ